MLVGSLGEKKEKKLLHDSSGERRVRKYREKQPIERKSKKEQESKEENKKRVKAEWKKEEGRERENGQVEIERQEARIRAERLDTSQHSKEETQLTRIRDINERTATRAGDLGHVEGGIHVATGENTEGHPGLGPGGGKLWRNGSGAGLGPLQEGEPEDALGEGGCLGEGSSGQCWGRE